MEAIASNNIDITKMYRDRYRHCMNTDSWIVLQNNRLFFCLRNLINVLNHGLVFYLHAQMLIMRCRKEVRVEMVQ